MDKTKLSPVLENKEQINTDEIKKELYSRLDCIGVNVEETMTFEQLQYFMKGYECCRYNMMDVIDETFRNIRKEAH